MHEDVIFYADQIRKELYKEMQLEPKEEEIPEDKKPTEKQIEMLKKYGLNIPKTKAAASEIIRRNNSERGERPAAYQG